MAMSDTSQGPGWWQASDHQWYPPELYPTEWQQPEAEAAPVVTEPEPVVAFEPAPVVTQPEPESFVPEPAPSEPVVTEPEPVVAFVPPAAVTPDVAAAIEQPTMMSSAPVATTGTDVGAAATEADELFASGFAAAATQAPGVDWTAPSAERPTGIAIGEDGQTWASPDPATAEPTMVQGIAPVTVDPTQLQPVVGAPTTAPAGTPLASSPSAWDDTPEMTVTKSDRSDPISATVAIVGAALLAVGSFMPWAEAAGTLTSGTVNGLSGSNGWGTLICGLVVLAGAALLLMGNRKPWVGGGIAFAGAVGLGLAVFSILDINSTSDDLPAVLRAENVSDAVASGAKLDLALGIWLATAGGVIALVGGLIALARRA
jgi:hypothetical protein